MRAKVIETLEAWYDLKDFATLVDVVTKAAEKREIPLLFQWLKLPDYTELYTVVKDLVNNLKDDDNAMLTQSIS